jgi:hypothetical protein
LLLESPPFLVVLIKHNGSLHQKEGSQEETLL